MLSLMGILKQANFLTLVVLSWCTVKIEGQCPHKCSCPPTPTCPPGISSVLDSCGCCKLCARQFNQECSATEPCDHIKGLRCHLGATGDPQRGLCRAEALGRPCELDGRVYQHSEDFQPSCEHRCTCIDGIVGCIPLCPHRVPLPEWRCARPRLAMLPGHCCQEWVCDDNNHIAEDDLILVSTPHSYKDSSDLASNELLLLMVPTPWDSSARDPQLEWFSSSQSHTQGPSTCLLQKTNWSPCSTTCGMGVSNRVTNHNPECQLTKEMRLCQVRECESSLVPSSLKKGKKCQRTVRPHEPTHITFAGCISVRPYRMRSCGTCIDGRCCEPVFTRTVSVSFHCPQGQNFTHSIMWIVLCSCKQNCSSQGTTQQLESLNLPNDIHTFTH